MSELLPRRRANINKYAVEKRIVNFENQEQEYNTVGLMGFSTMLTKIYKIGTTHIKLQQEMGSGLGTIFAAMSYDPDKMEKFCVEIFRPTTTKETLLYGERIAEEKKSQGEYLEKLGILKKKKLAAVQDVYLKGALFEPVCEPDGGVCNETFELGSKNDLEGVTFSTGGGATNGAVTFARQGLHSMYMGKIGHDVAGKAILDDLHKDGVDTSLVGYSKTVGSGYSCILLAPSGERTILSYRGASSHYEINLEDFHNAQPDWIYLTSLEGNFEVIDTIFEYARNNNIKIAMNPGKKELANKDHLKELIPNLTILSMNKEEMQQIYSGETLEDLVRQASQDVHYVIVTDGPNGAVASDRWHIVRAGMYEDVPVIDRTGAGDAFSSGFTAMIAAGESLEWAVTYASANSTSVVSTIGAKAGILGQTDQVHGMPLDVSEF